MYDVHDVLLNVEHRTLQLIYVQICIFKFVDFIDQ